MCITGRVPQIEPIVLFTCTCRHTGAIVELLLLSRKFLPIYDVYICMGILVY